MAAKPVRSPEPSLAELADRLAHIEFLLGRLIGLVEDAVGILPPLLLVRLRRAQHKREGKSA